MKRSPEIGLSRRSFLRLAAYCAGAAAAYPATVSGQSTWSGTNPQALRSGVPDFVPGHIEYQGGKWDEYPSAMASFMDEVRRRTSIEVGKVPSTVRLSDPDLFRLPFLYISGRYEFEMPAERDIERLRRHLTYGGFLLIDVGLGLSDVGFGKSARELVARLFPRKKLEPLSGHHAIYRSYYLLRSIGGRQSVSQILEGVHVGTVTPVVYCRNDLGGAWARNPDGSWQEECTPGGEPQRKAAFQLGVNIALYAMTGNYKLDLIHHPFIQKRLEQG